MGNPFAAGGEGERSFETGPGLELLAAASAGCHDDTVNINVAVVNIEVGGVYM
jgi:hypothetical protein